MNPMIMRMAAAIAVALVAACATPVPERCGFLGNFTK